MRAANGCSGTARVHPWCTPSTRTDTAAHVLRQQYMAHLYAYRKIMTNVNTARDSIPPWFTPSKAQTKCNMLPDTSYCMSTVTQHASRHTRHCFVLQQYNRHAFWCVANTLIWLCSNNYDLIASRVRLGPRRLAMQPSSVSPAGGVDTTLVGGGWLVAGG